MRQSNKTPVQASPSSEQLKEFSNQLTRLHPADLKSLVHVTAAFGWQFHPDMIDNFTENNFKDPLHELAEKAQVLDVVYPDIVRGSDGEEFSSFLRDLGKLLNFENSYFSSLLRESKDAEYHAAVEGVLAQIGRISAGLGFYLQTPGLRQMFREKVSMAAAVCVAILIYVLSSDHLPLWKVLAAVMLMVVFGGLIFRVGQKANHQRSTDVCTRFTSVG